MQKLLRKKKTQYLFRSYALICRIPGRARASEEPGHHGEDNETERRRSHFDVLQIDFPLPRDLIDFSWH